LSRRNGDEDAALPPKRHVVVVDILAAGWAIILAFLAGIILGFVAAVVLILVIPGT
jgi:hypothetical protein